jgi:hypothetical protein
LNRRRGAPAVLFVRTMSRPGIAAVVAALLIVIAVWSLRPRRGPGDEIPRNAGASVSSGAAAKVISAETGPIALGSGAAELPVVGPAEERIALADPLNAPDGTIQRDLDTLRIVLEAWRSNFPRDGNPVGENAEIAASLTGGNRLQLALIPKDHRAINPAGELCDRWGTPFRFHQISGEKMELRSAGPDRQFGTTDDATLSPP